MKAAAKAVKKLVGGVLAKVLAALAGATAGFRNTQPATIMRAKPINLAPVNRLAIHSPIFTPNKIDDRQKNGDAQGQGKRPVQINNWANANPVLLQR